MIHLDTSVLGDALTGPRRSAPALRRHIEDGERLLLSAIVLYEWLQGPQEALFPRAHAVSFGPDEAARAAEPYRSGRRPRGRAIDLAVAASALSHGAAPWTLHPDDFRDVPALRLAAG
jgi:predicted nucleic acid-binding protein